MIDCTLLDLTLDFLRLNCFANSQRSCSSYAECSCAQACTQPLRRTIESSLKDSPPCDETLSTALALRNALMTAASKH